MTLVPNTIQFLYDDEPGKKIEMVGRTCYRSDSAISNESYERFIKAIIKNGHTSVLEAERRLFVFDASIYEAEIQRYVEPNKYFIITHNYSEVLVSGNIRAWYELVGNLDGYDSPLPLQSISTYLSKDYPYIFKDYDLHIKCKYNKEAEEEYDDFDLDKHKEFTFKVVCSRTCSHQWCRSRTLSFAQESQRYCNYANDKFGNSISFVQNCVPDGTQQLIQSVEDKYFELIKNGEKPEDARQILPNCTATRLCITGTRDAWRKFCFLRSDSHAQDEIRGFSQKIEDFLQLKRKGNETSNRKVLTIENVKSAPYFSEMLNGVEVNQNDSSSIEEASEN